MPIKELTLSPAFGFDYKSQDSVLWDWDRNRDFQVESLDMKGSYCSKQTAEKMGVKVVYIKYANLTRTLKIEL